MMKLKFIYPAFVVAMFYAFVPSNALAAGGTDVATTYTTNCAKCHGEGRLGGMGPALLPENLSRLKRERAKDVIANGALETQMPGYRKTLSSAEIDALVKMIYTPLKEIPKWGMAEINASRIVYNRIQDLPEKPVYKADPLNLFTVVETGDHHVSIIDGKNFATLWRFKSRIALHGGAKYSPDGRFVYLVSRDGWVSMYDLHSLKPVAEIRAGINSRNIAISGDGRYIMVGNYLPHSLVILDARDLSLIKIIDVQSVEGVSSRVSAVYAAPPRESFIVALKDIPEVWVISYKDNPTPVAKGFVHSYRANEMEGAFDYGPFPVQRIFLDDYLDDFFFDQSYLHIIGTARNAKKGQVVSIISRLKIADIDLTGMPHLGSGITWKYKGRMVMATPNLKKGVVTIIDMKTWKTIKNIKTLGPGFFMRSHENTPYAWVDVFFGPNKDVIHVIDKRTLKIVKTLRPSPGKTAAHVEFTRDGRFALVSIWEMDGAIVIYDAVTLKEVKRIPMVKPSGKYNVFNKITYSQGTSH